MRASKFTDAKNRAKARVDITLIDRENQHPFQPSLYQVATAGLSPFRIRRPFSTSNRAALHKPDKPQLSCDGRSGLRV
jgi:NADH dehydrogenase FAD-containing subunit